MEWFTTKEAAELWGITTRRVQILCDRGKVNGVEQIPLEQDTHNPFHNPSKTHT